VNRIRVKVCGVRTPDTLDAAIDAGADAVGFVFAESPRRVSVDAAARLLARVPAFVARVGVFRHPSEEDVIEALEALPLDLVQTDAEDFDDGAACVPEAMRLPVVREGDGIETRAHEVLDSSRTILVEGRRSGAGERIDLDAIAALPHDTRARLIIAGGLSHDNIAEVIERLRPYGVDVSSGVERSRGEKDPELIHQFLRAVREAERSLL
jgi:phosphoribosylanthranilate isomerase